MDKLNRTDVAPINFDQESLVVVMKVIIKYVESFSKHIEVQKNTFEQLKVDMERSLEARSSGRGSQSSCSTTSVQLTENEVLQLQRRLKMLEGVVDVTNEQLRKLAMEMKASEEGKKVSEKKVIELEAKLQQKERVIQSLYKELIDKEVKPAKKRESQEHEETDSNYSSASTENASSVKKPIASCPKPPADDQILPEDDPLACRHLLIGNFDFTVTKSDLSMLLRKFGFYTSLRIRTKRGNEEKGLAFVSYKNLDMAYRAKRQLSGYKFGSGKLIVIYDEKRASNRVWVGGLGEWTTADDLLKFRSFGVISKTEYSPGDSSALIEYRSREHAKEAVEKMRGFPLGGPERRLRTDFAADNKRAAQGRDPRERSQCRGRSSSRRNNDKGWKTVEPF